MVGNSSYFDWTDDLFDVRKVFDKPEALADIRVLELATIIMGPSHADFLGEFGAEVIKVELPGVGDVMRHVIPDGQPWKNANPAFFPQSHSKYHVTIDVRQSEGQELFRQLATRCDVLVENVTPGTMDSWGLSYRQLQADNPRLIYVADSGFGQWGPFSRRPSYEGAAQLETGFAYLNGFAGRPLVKVGSWIGDYFGALLGAVSVVAALEYREKTGLGQFIDFSQGEGFLRMMDWTWCFQELTGEERGQYGNYDVALVPCGIFRCRDGFVALAAGRDTDFAGLCRAMKREDLLEDARFAILSQRLVPANAEVLYSLIAQWVVDLPRAEVDTLGEVHGFGAAPVLNAADIYGDAHFRARGSVWAVDDELYGQVVDHGPGPKLSKTPGRHKWVAKPLGYHNAHVFGTLLGLSSREMWKLESKGIIGGPTERPGAAMPPPADSPDEGGS